jgi:hypothetical protein
MSQVVQHYEMYDEFRHNDKYVAISRRLTNAKYKKNIAEP